MCKSFIFFTTFSDAGLPSGENTNQNHFENTYQAQIAAYQQYYQQNPHLYGHHHSHQPLNPGQPGYQNPYQPYAAAHFSNQLSNDCKSESLLPATTSNVCSLSTTTNSSQSPATASTIVSEW